jgi:hypothetical protein
MARGRAVGIGAGAALALAVPAALLAQVLDVLAEGDGPPGVVYLLVPVVLGAMVVGGWVAGRQSGGARPWAHGALAALAAVLVVLGVGVVRLVAAGESVPWGTVPATAATAALLGSAGGALGGRTPGRTRP